jgi:ribonuclease BN (tRNA processing enzyme)
VLELDVLGCSGGWPAAGRPGSGYLVSAGGTRLWLDAGPGTLVELLRRCTLDEVAGIWVSHLHPDHCSDLVAALWALANAERPRAPLPVFGPPGWAARIDGLVGSAVSEVCAVHELRDRATFRVGELALEAVGMAHGVPTFGLRVTDRVGTVLAYTADTGPGAALDALAAGSDVLLGEAFRSAPTRHDATVLTPEQLAAAAARGAVGRLVLTHLHPDAEPAAARERAARVYRGPIDVAEPGLRVAVSTHRDR